MASPLAIPKRTNPLLARYLQQLATHPLRTKAITSGTLSFLQEIIGSNVAGVPVQRPSKDAPFLFHVLARAHINLKALKLALYGFFIAAPLSHYGVGRLQAAFVGKTGAKWRIAQILASNLFMAPIQTAVFLSSMSVINGTKSVAETVKAVKAGFFPAIRIMWVVSPTAMFIAQNFLPMELWVPFFNFVQFTVGTYFNIRVKQLRLAAIQKEQARKKAEEEEKKAADANSTTNSN